MNVKESYWGSNKSPWKELNYFRIHGRFKTPVKRNKVENLDFQDGLYPGIAK